MTTAEIICSVLLIVVSLAIIILVLAQKNRQADASAVSGASSSSFFDKTQGHSKDAALAKMTIILGGVLVLLVLTTLGITLFA